AGMGASETCGGKNAAGVTQALVHGDVEAGMSAKVLAQVDLFGLYKWKKECTLFDVNALKQTTRRIRTRAGRRRRAPSRDRSRFRRPCPRIRRRASAKRTTAR
ncbi:hypothetical protein G6O46_24830, partial [Salmonella enterica subsp. enterica serovar Enteritidis]|uniref:hypothetical protein n=1 Tax=Salmonella enterica TaxID=28901 RepID=UPI0016549872